MHKNTYPTAGLYCSDGTVGLPSISFNNSNTTGLYRIGADNIGFSVAGTKEIDISVSSVDFSSDVNVSGALTASETSSTWSASMYNSTTQTIPHNTATVLTFNTENYDTSTGSNMVNLANNRIDIKKNGIYLVNLKWGFDVDTAGQRRAVWIEKNGNNICQDERYIDPDGFGFGSITYVIQLTAPDHIRFATYITNSDSGSVSIGSNADDTYRVVGSCSYLGSV